MKILVTGAAGFIGYFTAKRLLDEGHEVVGLDNFNSYYDVSLKESRAFLLDAYANFEMKRVDLADAAAVEGVFKDASFSHVVHLAAQAGVRYSLENPRAYVESNLMGFVNILECCRHYRVEHLVFASSSSVYGANTKIPFSVHHNVDHPVSLYAASKKSNELMAHSYAHLFGLPATGLRFFTVYGPWGRPDMAYYSFTSSIIKGIPIDVFNNGKMRRDFTYIDDIIDGICRVIPRKPVPDPAWSGKNPDPGSAAAPYRIYNIGNNKPTELMRFIEIIEKSLGKKAALNFKPMQPGDVKETYADIDDLSRDTGYSPRTTVEEGIPKFIAWYREYHGV
ncbi:MAG: NAD-dependent epimerase [Spirochaetes bacterium]|nr:MAG: NAD-dependent epimerase [Spirochaetota bacterium]